MPSNIKELQRVLGFVNYFRKFIPKLIYRSVVSYYERTRQLLNNRRCIIVKKQINSNNKYNVLNNDLKSSATWYGVLN